MFMKSSGLLGDLGFTLEMTVGSGTVWWKSSHRGGQFGSKTLAHLNLNEYRIRGSTVGERRCYKGVVGTRSHVQGTHFIFAKSAHEGIDFQLVLGKTSSGLKGSQDLRKSIGYAYSKCSIVDEGIDIREWGRIVTGLRFTRKLAVTLAYLGISPYGITLRLYLVICPCRPRQAGVAGICNGWSIRGGLVIALFDSLIFHCQSPGIGSRHAFEDSNGFVPKKGRTEYSLPSFPESRALIDCIKGAYIALILSPFELNKAYPYPLAFYRYGPADSRFNLSHKEPLTS
ncbi:hypothetical protein ACOSQ2_003191 [Xanthoceras sorbifolium]